MRRIARERTVLCAICDSAFQTTHSQGKYCSDECRRMGARKSWNKYSAKNRQARRINHNSWYAENKKEKAATVKKYRQTAKGKAVMRKSDINQKRKYPEKTKAREITNTAKKRGLLKPKPCVVCGSITNIHAHHPNYTKPLEIEWLCPQHHTDLHKEMRNAA